MASAEAKTTAPTERKLIVLKTDMAPRVKRRVIDILVIFALFFVKNSRKTLFQLF